MTPRLVPLGDSCIAMVFEDKIDPGVNARCVAMAASLEQSAQPGIRDVVPTYNSVTVHFDPIQCDRREMEAALGSLAAMNLPDPVQRREPVEIPVEYGGEFGPDLAAIAEFGGCSDEDAIHLHSRRLYRVYMLGFLPGFAYLGLVDSRIAMPRLETPRLRVPAGSVGIAGAQTGVYPYESPGGWRIIGRTRTRMVDPSGPRPFLLEAGDRVKFVAV